MADTSALVRQFEPGSLPELVAKMALGIAQAQGALNQDFAARIADFVRLFGLEGKGGLKNAKLFLALLERLAPPRYQFTETTIELRADLSLAGRRDLAVGLGGSAGGFTLQAGFASSSAFSYRGAASIRTVIHAIPADKEVFEALLERVAKLPDLQLPATQSPGEGLDELLKLIGATDTAVEAEKEEGGEEDGGGEDGGGEDGGGEDGGGEDGGGNDDNPDS